MANVARQLYQLQEIELALAANDEAQIKTGVALRDEQELVKARGRLASEQKRLDDLARQQKETEWAIDDLSAKIKNIEKKLYDGKTTNPKELAAMQAEAFDFRKKRSALEDKALDLMDQAEAANKTMAEAKTGLAAAEEQWRVKQGQLNAEMEKLRAAHADLESQRSELLPQIEAPAVQAYRDLRKRRGLAVARIEQGICKGCRITLPNSDLQQAKGGGLVRCSSCGRILYLP